jgi:hypothetical protein
MDLDGLTAAQKRRIEAIKAKMLKTVTLLKWQAEVKTCEVEAKGGYAFLYLIVGREKDEGLVAEFVGRVTFHGVIRKGGGVKIIRLSRASREIEKKYHSLYF